MNLLYLTFGDNISNHIQAQFSIFSFLSRKHEINTINIVTDQPSFYNNIKQDVNIIPISKETITEWEGAHKFFWRVKIKAIEMLCSMYANEPIVYLDSDTFLFNDIKTLKGILTNGSALMHENEGQLSTAKGKTVKLMWEQVKGKKYDGVTIQPHHCMWNAGVVAFPNSKDKKECELALHITDEMCSQGVTRRLIEQFALSVALTETYGLQPADMSIAHYWSNKNEWVEKISALFMTSYFKGDNIEEITKSIGSFNYKNIPVIKKEKNTKKRLEKILGNIFPPKEIQFIK